MSESHGSAPGSTPNLEKSLRHLFVRWLLAAIAALTVATVFNAWTSNNVFAADVFIDEGEGDFEKPTPVETPADGAAFGATSSEPSVGSDSGVGLDFDADFNAGKSGTADAGTPNVIDTTAPQVESTMQDVPVVPVAETQAVPEKPVKKVEKAAKKPVAAKAAKNSKAVKSDKKTAKNKSAKATKTASKSEKSKGKKVGDAKKSSKKKSADKAGKKARKVASIKYAGGQYVTTSRDCAMESAPGAGDSIGQTKASRKLWVEDAGDNSYWKVYSKSGQAAYLSRSCF